MDWDDLTDELEGITLEPNRSTRLVEYRNLLADLTPGDEGYAEVLTCLGAELRDEGQLDEARHAFLAAVEDSGRTAIDPLVGLLTVALSAGDDSRADELLILLMVKSRADELGISAYEWIGESLEDAGRLKQALRWFTIPLRDIQPGDVDFLPVVCLNGRFRVRRALGLPLDAYDDSHDVWHEVNDLPQ